MIQNIICVSATETMIPAIIALIQAQEARQYRRDRCLRAPRSPERIEGMLFRHFASAEPPLVALDPQGRVRGYASPTLWELNDDSSLHAFLTARNGIVRSLALPSPQQDDALAVAEVLLRAQEEAWQRQQTTGEVLRWPWCDTWVEPVILRLGFMFDSVCAIYPSQPPLSSKPVLLPGYTVRQAEPKDEATLIGLFEEELHFHEPYTPFVRASTRVTQAFHVKLERLWGGYQLEAGTPLVLVVEKKQQVVALAECSLLDVSFDDEPGFTPLGRYGCIDNLCVREEVRGQGIGRLLVQAVFAALSTVDLDGYALWYNPDNPLAHQFWRKIGFQPLWCTYQRPHTGPYAQEQRL